MQETDCRRKGQPVPIEANRSTTGTAARPSGLMRRGRSTSAFIPPVPHRGGDGGGRGEDHGGEGGAPGTLAEKALKGLDQKLVDIVSNEIMDHNPNVAWDDIAGLEFAKDTIQEIVVWPMRCPELFTGLRAAFKGLLLFGPPGTGWLVSGWLAQAGKAQVSQVRLVNHVGEAKGSGSRDRFLAPIMRGWKDWTMTGLDCP